MTFDIQEILGLLPHRYPFLLIDRVVEFEPSKRLVAIKNVTINEPFFQGHFPGYPIMPGVLVVEAMAQAGAIIMMTEIPDREKKLVVFTGIERAKFRRPVTPGDQLRIEVDVLSMRPASAASRARPMWTASWPARPRSPARWCQSPRTRRRPLNQPQRRSRQTKRWPRSEHPSQRGDRSRRGRPGLLHVGPFCTIGPEVVLGEDCTLISHVVLDGRTRIGARNIFHPFCSIGVPPQDLKYRRRADGDWRSATTTRFARA